MGACFHDWPMTGLVRQTPVTTTDYDDPVTTKNNSITSDFWIISGVVLQIFCIFLVSLSFSHGDRHLGMGACFHVNFLAIFLMVS